MEKNVIYVKEKMNMEETIKKVNKRYIEIDSCLSCGHNGHISSADRGGVVFICSNPDHLNLDIPKEFIGRTAYPVIVREQNNTVHMCPIPSWCTLPKKLDMRE
jgi:hypothetical protein